MLNKLFHIRGDNEIAIALLQFRQPFEQVGQVLDRLIAERRDDFRSFVFELYAND